LVKAGTFSEGYAPAFIITTGTVSVIFTLP